MKRLVPEMAELPRNELVIGGYWTEGGYRMISAIGESADKIWTKHIGKSGKIWLLPKDEEVNSMVIVQGDPGSQGFGGRDMHFKLDDGTSLMLRGPWSSNHDAFFAETGVDRRSHYRTWGCIGLDHGYVAYRHGYAQRRSCILDLIHVDPEGGCIGTYDRIDDLAKQIAFEQQVVVARFSQTYGGSSMCGAIFPSAGDPEYAAWLKKAGWGAKKPEPWATMDALALQKRRDTYGEYKYDQPQYIADDQWVEGIDVQPPPPPKPTFDDMLDEAFEEADSQGYY